MRKRLIALVLAVLFGFGSHISAAAHGDAAAHWKDMSRVLFDVDSPFGRYSNKEIARDVSKSIWALRFACQIAIDQTNGNDVKSLRLFRALEKISGLPSSIAEIDLGNVESSDHRAYTHMGWNTPPPLHPTLGTEWYTRWEKRKKIMLNTAEQIFNFNKNWEWVDSTFPSFTSYTEQCDAFCALLYYVHLLGDHYEFTHATYRSNRQAQSIMPLGGTEDASIISELRYYIPILFSESRDTDRLLHELDSLDGELRTLIRETNDFYSPERFSEYTELVDKILKVLRRYIPDLLNTQPWWTKVFPN